MQTKLTLTLEQATIRAAKLYAEQHHTSLSRMVQDFFRDLTEKPMRKPELTGVLRDLSGVLKGERIGDLKRAKRNRLAGKFGS